MRRGALALTTALGACISIAACGARDAPATPNTDSVAKAPVLGTATSLLRTPLETEEWERIRTPGARAEARFVYDPIRGQGTLFGDSFTTDRASTWLWNGFAFLERTTRRGMRSPSVRTGHALAWDPVRQNVVLFGGSLSSAGLAGDTWTWNGRTWTEIVSATHPGARTAATLVWDDERKNLVLYGGQDAAGNNTETWTFDGARWSFAYANLPPGRNSTHVAWDPVRKNIVLFGGMNAQPLNDTWLWSGKDWRPATALGAPAARSLATFTWDGTSKKLVLFGGTNANGLALGDTAVFDGKSWEAITGAQPPARLDATAIWDDARQEIVLFGGRSQIGTPLDDTWTFHQDRWSKVDTAGPKPSGRWDATMSWDPQRRSVFLYGGAGQFGQFTQPADAWYWNGTQWSLAASPQAPLEREDAAFVYDPVHEQVVLFGGYSTNAGTILNDTWVWNGRAWAQRGQAAPSPLGRARHSMVWDAARKNIVMFGGTNFTTYMNDTWIWDGSQWTVKPSPQVPQARTNGRLGFDPGSKLVVLVGGSSNLGSFRDVWTWDGTTWLPSLFTGATGTNFLMATDEERKQLVIWEGGAQTWLFRGGAFDLVSNAGRPTNMGVATFSWDPIRKSLFLIGGNTPQMNVWAWNGTNWTDRSALSNVRPQRRSRYHQFWDPARRVTVIAGGFGNSGYTDDTWSYDGTNWKLIEPSGEPFDGFPTSTYGERGFLHEASRRGMLFRGPDDLGTGATWTYHARGGSCTTAADCASGFCVDRVCCEHAACGPCETCADPSSPGRCASITRAEDPDTCSASDRKICNEDGQCVRTLGAECTQSSDCASGFCANPFPGAPMVGPNKGVCCDKACNGQCEACAAALKLSQKDDGVCGGANVGTNPGFYCRNELSCNSAGACAPEPTAYCKDRGTAVDRLGRETACGRYACERGVCLSRCANDSQCGLARTCSVDGYCDLLSDSGCAAGPGNARETPTPSAWALLVGLAVFARRRNRRRTSVGSSAAND